MKPPVLVLLALTTACAPPPASPPAPAPAAETATTTRVTGRAAAHALVTLEPVTDRVPLPPAGALMDQFAKQFVPETLFVRVGQDVTFRNSEDQLHNVTVTTSRTGTSVFNISQSPFETYQHVFERAGEYDVTCDVHPGMRATIVATVTPYAVYADQGGRFELAAVPPGAYRLRVSAGGQQQGREIAVSGAAMDLVAQ